MTTTVLDKPGHDLIIILPIKTLDHLSMKYFTYPQVCADDEGEDLGHCLIVERVHADDVEVAQVARRHIVTTTAGWTHRTEKLNVLERDLGCVL